MNTKRFAAVQGNPAGSGAFIKGMVSAVITIAVYKKLTPLINGKE